MIIRKNPEKNRNPEKSGTRKKSGKTCKIRNFSGKSGRSGNTRYNGQFNNILVSISIDTFAKDESTSYFVFL
jgi:hypothetical protein